MNPFQVKVFMLKNGLTITSMAEDLADENRKKTSLLVMISDLIYGRRFYPSLAEELDTKFGLKIERPAKIESARKIVQKAA